RLPSRLNGSNPPSDHVELMVKREPEHARVCDGRGLATDASRQVGRDLSSQRLALGQDRVRVDDIENRALRREGHVFTGMEESPQADIKLVQPRREPAARRHQWDQLRTL